MNKIIKVYVAGAYSDNNIISCLKNIGRGEEIASQLFLKGYAPFTPWHNKDFVIKNWREKIEVSQFYNYSIAWLYVSDCVLLVPNHEGLKNWNESIGTLKEIEEAKKHNIPVFRTLAELHEYYLN